MGIDIGTTGCKVIAFDNKGDALATAYREYPVLSPNPGWAELDSRAVINHCKDCITQVAMDVKDSDPVVAIAASSQGEAFTVIDCNDKYLCNAMVSSDMRCQKQVRQLTEQIGLDNLYKTTGASPHTMCSLFKLAWLRENMPEILDNASKILCFEDLLGYELTGQTVIDYSMAGRTMLFDITSKSFCTTILDSVGINKDVLSQPVPSGTVVGKIKPDIAEQLNLSKDVVVVAGGHDQPCGALGAGAVEPGVAIYATGTVECICPAFEKLLLSDTLRKSNLATYHHVAEGLYTTVAFNLTGGNLLRWFRDEFGAEEKRLAKDTGKDVYDLLLKQIPSEPTNIFVLPHFTPTGTPHFDTCPTGAILGLDLTTTRGQFIKALLEGITYEMRLNVEILAQAGNEIKELRAVGGGAKSEIWMQLKSDIIGLPIVSLNISEAACFGAAMLAAAGAGAVSSPKEAAKMWVKPSRTFTPNKKNLDLYDKKYDIYRNLYETVKPIGSKIAEKTCLMKK